MVACFPLMRLCLVPLPPPHLSPTLQGQLSCPCAQVCVLERAGLGAMRSDLEGSLEVIRKASQPAVQLFFKLFRFTKPS